MQKRDVDADSRWDLPSSHDGMPSPRSVLGLELKPELQRLEFHELCRFALQR